MKFFRKLIFFLCCAVSASNHFVSADQNAAYKEIARPRLVKIQSALELVPAEYQKDVLSAFKKSGRNGWELIKAIQNVSPQQREGMAFLIANMPGRDLVALNGDFLI